MTTPEFSLFIAIDWSGAKSGYTRKLKLAVCPAGDAPPALVEPLGGWSRVAIRDWLRDEILPKHRALIGLDCSFAPPFGDDGYFPGDTLPATAPALWAMVDRVCTDDDLGAASFLERDFRRHFYFGKADGEKAKFMRLRRCEQAFNQKGGGKPSSIFDAVGAAQVAKASFAGMRLLHQLHDRLAVWPFDPVPRQGAVMVEIYCRLFLRLATASGRKIRDRAALDAALLGLASAPIGGRGSISDDESDALIGAAGLRHLNRSGNYWRPHGLSAKVAATEGWTFGVD